MISFDSVATTGIFWVISLVGDLAAASIVDAFYAKVFFAAGVAGFFGSGFYYFLIGVALTFLGQLELSPLS